MIPLASAAPASYQNVFGVVTIPEWVQVPSVFVFAIFGVVGLVILFTSARKLTRWIAAGLFVAAVAQLGVLGLVMSDQSSARLANITSDIQQKYGAKVQDTAVEVYQSDDVIETGRKYHLTLPDGATGDYTIRFDRTNSEPFVVSTPTPEQLEQQGAKK